MGGLCPHCEDAFGELVDHDETGTGKLVHTFECPNCGHEWNYSL